MMKHVYLDYSATTPVDPRVLEAMNPFYSGEYGNASSIHAYGRRARLALEESREVIARFIGAKQDELFFTSGGTESDNHAVNGIASARRQEKRLKIVTTSIEHHAILEPVEMLASGGYSATFVGVDAHGMVDLDQLKNAIDGNTCLVSVIHGNNEVGTIQPLKEIAAICRSKGITVHTDAVQTVGKIPVSVDDLGIDALSLTAHKLYGPKGIGAIYIRKGTKIDSFMKGGAQESNRRAGTENVPLAVGFAKAIEICGLEMDRDRQNWLRLRELLRKRLFREFEGIIFNGHETYALPNILNVSFDASKQPIDGEALIMGMDLHGVAVTSGSACTSGSLQPSHVLLAMGRDEQTARATIRFSLGRGTSEDDIDYAVDALKEVVEKARKKE
jgi:cysteine desulfurase